MAMKNPVGRANYEPNSWSGEEGGPRECPHTGYTSVPQKVEGEKRRLRAESFRDHYSQARQFYRSQTPVEQRHMRDALVFELSKVETPAIRKRVVGHLLHVDEDLATGVASGLGLNELPEAPTAAAEPKDLGVSDALSILKNSGETFAGRTVGILVSDGADIQVLNALRSALEKEGAYAAIVAPKVGGIEASDGTRVEADEQVEGGPSVLFDAVAIVTTAEGAASLASMPSARDFLSDALAHFKFIGYVAAAEPLFDRVGAEMGGDDGQIALDGDGAAGDFVAACRSQRYWEREP